MEIKVDININLNNINQIINQLSQLIPGRIQPSEKIEINKSLETKIDITELREKVAHFASSGNVAQVQELLQKYNAKKVTDVKPEDYEKLYNDIAKHIN